MDNKGTRPIRSRKHSRLVSGVRVFVRDIFFTAKFTCNCFVCFVSILKFAYRTDTLNGTKFCKILELL